MTDTVKLAPAVLETLARKIKSWARELGFADAAITDVDLDEHKDYLNSWIAAGHHGEMGYMEKHADLRASPASLLEGTIRIISVRMDYAMTAENSLTPMNDPSKGYVSRYARGRDYHKMIRQRLQKLANLIEGDMGPFGYRAFVDSAPVLERALAEKAGLGWIGKNTMLINKQAGSWFFLGELFTDIPLPVDEKGSEHCGSCSACLEVCPTNAFVDPYQLDARKCISYLTIELRSSIPTELRPLMGNRVFGCDDCQLICPWNKFTKPSSEQDFKPRHGLDDAELTELFLWSEEEFETKTRGSAIRRIGYEYWLRNIAIGLGNAARSDSIIAALRSREEHASALVREHVAWALQQHVN